MFTFKFRYTLARWLGATDMVSFKMLYRRKNLVETPWPVFRK